jgi:hypothetical protein
VTLSVSVGVSVSGEYKFYDSPLSEIILQGTYISVDGDTRG